MTDRRGPMFAGPADDTPGQQSDPEPSVGNSPTALTRTASAPVAGTGPTMSEGTATTSDALSRQETGRPAGCSLSSNGLILPVRFSAHKQPKMYRPDPEGPLVPEDGAFFRQRWGSFGPGVEVMGTSSNNSALCALWDERSKAFTIIPDRLHFPAATAGSTAPGVPTNLPGQPGGPPHLLDNSNVSIVGAHRRVGNSWRSDPSLMSSWTVEPSNAPGQYDPDRRDAVALKCPDEFLQYDGQNQNENTVLFSLHFPLTTSGSEEQERSVL